MFRDSLGKPQARPYVIESLERRKTLEFYDSVVSGRDIDFHLCGCN